MVRSIILLLATLAGLQSGAQGQGAETVQGGAEAIGTCRLEDDGSIVLELYRPALAILRYRPTDPDYQSIAVHGSDRLPHDPSARELKLGPVAGTRRQPNPYPDIKLGFHKRERT